MNTSININNFKEICRICLQNKGSTPVILTTEIIHMIESCASVQGNYIDKKMPQQLCNNCYTHLEIAHEFKQQYFKATQILTEIILKKDQSRPTQSKDEIGDEKIVKTEVKQENDFEYEEQVEVHTDEDNCENSNDSKTQDASETKHIYLDDKNEESPLNLKKQHKKETKSNLETTKIDSSHGGVTCPICGIKFKCQKYYKSHLRSHSDERPYKCTECEKSFKHKYMLKVHKREKHENPDYREICFICGELLVPSGFHNHMSRYHRNSRTNEKFKCYICNCEFPSVHTLREHKKQNHSDVVHLQYDCDICGKTFATIDKLDQHKQRRHIGGRKYPKRVLKENAVTCKICGKKFKFHKCYQVHMRTHSNERPYKCTECEKTFKLKYMLTAHRREEHENPNLRDICFICGISVLPTRFPGHMSRHHRNWSNISNSMHTLKEHTDAVPVRHDCDICGKTFATTTKLRQHKQRVHTDEKKLKCEFCDKHFKLNYHRRRHTDAVHKDLRPHPCFICDKAFHLKTHLKKHMITHTGERPHACEQCGKAFGTKTHLRTHQKVHSK